MLIFSRNVASGKTTLIVFAEEKINDLLLNCDIEYVTMVFSVD